MDVYIVVGLILLAGSCTCGSKSIRNKNADAQRVTTVESSKSPVDLGILTHCTSPIASDINMGVCSKHVEYSVSSVLLNPLTLSNTLLYISSVYSNVNGTQQFDGYDATECAEVVLKYICSLYFPRCEPSTHQLRAEFLFNNCNQEIESKCSPKIKDHLLLNAGICYINTTNVTAAKCKRSSEYTFRREEGYCSSAVTGWSDVYLTELMYVQLQQVEKLIEGTWRGFNQTLANNLAVAKECTQAYARLACRSVGKCWDKGTRAEMTATKEDCEKFLGCFWVKIDGFNCSNFPSESIIPLTPPTPVTELASILPVQSEVFVEFPLDASSSSSLHSLSLLGLLVLSVLLTAGLS